MPQPGRMGDTDMVTVCPQRRARRIRAKRGAHLRPGLPGLSPRGGGPARRTLTSRGEARLWPCSKRMSSAVHAHVAGQNPVSTGFWARAAPSPPWPSGSWRPGARARSRRRPAAGAQPAASRNRADPVARTQQGRADASLIRCATFPQQACRLPRVQAQKERRSVCGLPSCGTCSEHRVRTSPTWG